MISRFSAILALLAASAALAQTLQLTAEGTITGVANPSIFASVGVPIEEGDPWRMTIRYDRGVAPTAGDAFLAIYPSSSLTLSIDGASWLDIGPLRSVSLAIANDLSQGGASTPGDAVLLTAAIDAIDLIGEDFDLRFSLTDPTETAFETNELPSSLALVDFPDRFLELSTTFELATADGTVDSVDLTEIAPCPDLAGDDRLVSGADLANLLARWGPHRAGEPADLDADAVIGPSDLATLLAAWGPCDD